MDLAKLSNVCFTVNLQSTAGVSVVTCCLLHILKAADDRKLVDFQHCYFFSIEEYVFGASGTKEARWCSH